MDHTAPGSSAGHRASALNLQAYHRVALCLALGIAVLTTVLLPGADKLWPKIPAFLPTYQTAIIGTYAVAAYLIYTFFKEARTVSLLYLWGGSVYTAIVLAAQFLAVPGAFIPDKQLLGGPQTAIWLWFFWHMGAAGMLFLYALAEWRQPGRTTADAGRAFRLGTGITALVVVATLLAVTLFHDALPAMDKAGDYRGINSTGVGPLTQCLIVAALVMLWLATGFKSRLNAWLGLALVALLFDNTITMAGGMRLSAGWYVGRLNALFSALVLLFIYLREVNQGYLKSADRARQLAVHQETLEQQVAERTRVLEETKNALMHAQKLEAIGKLTGGVAHDFNNALHVISGNLDLIKLLSQDNEKVQARCKSAQDAVKRGAKLSSQLLAFARKQPLQPTSISLERVLNDMDVLLKRAVGDRIKVDIAVSGQAWNTQADAQQLENVILNLAMNAADAISGNGELRIEVCNRVLGSEDVAAIPDLSPGQYIMISFHDSGSGMTPEVKERVFEPFFTTKPVGKGTGLGLSMVYGFVKQSGGHIDIETAVGTGTTIRILLPRSLGKEDARPDSGDSTVVGGSETILVVEDDLDVQANVAGILSGLGYQVLKADNADQAAIIIRSPAHIDLLFTDVVMPGQMTSTELASLAKQLRPGLPVLFTSGYTQEAIVHNGRLAQGVHLLSKPYQRDDLARALRNLLPTSDKPIPILRKQA